MMAQHLNDEELNGVSGGNSGAVQEAPYKIHIVKPGEALSVIAMKLGMSLKELLKWNPEITNPDRIEIGQEILYPTKKEK